MSFDEKIEFTKENIDTYLKEIAKEYRKQIGKKLPAEMILIGGASVLINYGFREMTIDIDAEIQAASVMKDVINNVGNKYNLPKGWINDDFKKTNSYSSKLRQYAKHYKEFSNVLEVYTIDSEYLIAMKLKSGRIYKSDFSDILGILAEHEKAGKPLDLETIKKAVKDLYGKWSSLSKESQNFINNVMNDGHFSKLYNQISRKENDNKLVLLKFEKDYPEVLKESNVNQLASKIQREENTENILTVLRKKRKT